MIFFSTGCSYVEFYSPICEHTTNEVCCGLQSILFNSCQNYVVGSEFYGLWMWVVGECGWSDDEAEWAIVTCSVVVVVMYICMG